MKNKKELRWQQRFQNLKKAYTQLHQAVSVADSLNQLEKEGLVQRFEYTFELAWKTIKDYLESEGITVAFPREVIKSGFHYGIIQDGEVWMDMLENRNLMSHTYDEKKFKIAITKIVKVYFDAISQVYNDLERKI